MLLILFCATSTDIVKRLKRVPECFMGAGRTLRENGLRIVAQNPDIRELKQATFLTTRTPTESQSSCLVAVKNVACLLSSLLVMLLY